ncbi:MAG: hypothetical protein QSU88_09750, partial [Candidatus Methanoperedens sp.]|nr:hypothetical protein [Candidatus Methanoperedens sp.]
GFMNYFSKIVMIKYVCGHKKLGIDTYQPFVTKNSVKCPKCSEERERKNFFLQRYILPVFSLPHWGQGIGIKLGSASKSKLQTLHLKNTASWFTSSILIS